MIEYIRYGLKYILSLKKLKGYIKLLFKYLLVLFIFKSFLINIKSMRMEM